MKKFTLLFSSLLFTCLSLSQAQNTWTKKANFEGIGRANAIGFSIGNKGYLGTGYHYNYYGTYTRDFWEYDPITDSWTQKANFGGDRSAGAVSFSIGNKGYVGLGDSPIGAPQHFWQYDPTANTWTKKADFPGDNQRGGPLGFSINGKGYIGLGIYMNDFWEYDPTADTWTQKQDFPGDATYEATGFSIGSYGYIGTGETVDDERPNDFWQYDPESDTWTKKADFGGAGRLGAVGFSIGDKGYIGTGLDNMSSLRKDFWQYDPALDTWTQKADFRGYSRYHATGFSIGNYGYIGTGYSDLRNNLRDFWEYLPGNNPACVIPVPGEVTNISNSTATLNWNVVPGAVGYSVRYKMTSALEWITAHSTDNHKMLSDLIAATEYTWEVKSICSLSPFFQSDWMDEQYFKTTSERIRTDQTSDQAFEIFPNPFSSSAIISFSSNENDQVLIELYDLTGRNLQTLLDENGSSGIQEITWDRESISSGIYFLKLTINQETTARKVIIE